MFAVLQKNTNIVSHYFDLRTKSCFQKVMHPALDVSAYWCRQEFAKSTGMIHWHELCWRHDKESHNLLQSALETGLADNDCAKLLSDWAKTSFHITASHPAGLNDESCHRKDMKPPPEETASAPHEDKNPLLKLLMNVSKFQESLLEDHLLLTNRINIHRCSNSCLSKTKYGPNKGQQICRMECGSKDKLAKSWDNPQQ